MYLGHLQEVKQEGEQSTAASESAPIDELTKAHVMVKYLTDTLRFTRQLEEAVPIVSQLLGSKTATDIVEAINFFTVATTFQLNNAIHGVRKMLALVWSKDADIREAVMTAYKELYFSADKALYPSAKV